MKKFILFCAILLLLNGCAAVKGYDRVYLNDPDMALSGKALDRFEINFQTYREAAAGANGNKTGGGCGCN